MKKLYFGDCLYVLKELNKEHPNGFIDLIYIDPPFNSKRDYNVLFESIDLSDSTAQKQAFADTWSNVSYLDTLNEIQSLDLDLFQFLQSLDSIRVPKSAVAYLTMMAIRIHYMQRVLKEAGTFYLHCDPTMSHYLKLLCDLIFGERNFRTEISWRRSNPKSLNVNNFANCRDVILRYSKSDKVTFNKVFGEHDEEYVEKAYKYKDEGGRRYRLLPLLNPNKDRPNLTYTFLGVLRVWRWTKERMEKAYSEGLVVQLKQGAVPQYKLYLEDSKGKVITNDWNDIEQAAGSESLGYPTQKPEGLLERIVTSSSNEGDLVADFFCGCGTTVAVAEHLNRQWIGADISHLAIRLIAKRLRDHYRGNKAKLKELTETVETHGLPKDIASAKELAQNVADGRFGFQDWVIEVMMGGVSNEKKVADGGYDGYLTFNKTEKQKEIVLIEVKSGNVTVKNIREFIQVVNTKKAVVGVFVCFKETVTQPMLHEAKKEGYYDRDTWGDKFDKIQILTIEDLLNGDGVNIPTSTMGTFKTAVKKKKGGNEQLELTE